MRIALALAFALWFGWAAAQVADAAPRVPSDAAGARLPLASAGTVLRWVPDADEVFFDLPATSWIRLAVYSPSIDVGEVGDERYDDRPLEAVFELTGSAGEDLALQRFSLAPSGWVTLFDGLAREGRHVLRSRVLGHGKNVYLLRLETEFSDVALYGDSVTINVSRRDWHPALAFRVDTSARCELGMYDGDGDDELEAVLVLPSGARVRPTVSGDLAWSAQPLPRMQGLYTVELRVPPRAYQATNAVRFELRCGGEGVPLPLVPPATLVAPQPGPIVVEVVDVEGRPVDLGYRVEGRYDRLVTLDEDDDYRLVGIETRGGALEDERAVAFGAAGGFVRFVVEPARVAVRVPVPEVRAVVPAPLPLPLPVPTVALPGSPMPLPLPAPVAALVPVPTQVAPAPAEVAPQPAETVPTPAALELARRVAPDALLPCEMAEVRLTVANRGGLATAYALREALPEGLGVRLDAGHALTWSGSLAAGEVADHAYVVEMGPGVAEVFTLVARLTGDDDEHRDDGRIERAVAEVELVLVAGDRTLYADEAFEVEARVRNPLGRPVRLWLVPNVSSRVALVDGPAEVELPAGGTVVARYLLAGREAGAAALQMLAYACDPTAGDVPAAGPTTALRFTLADVPDLPTPTLSTEVTVDLSAGRLPRLEGLAVVSRVPEGARYLAGSGRVGGEVVDDPREVDGALVFELDAAPAAQLRYTLLHEQAIVVSDAEHALIARTPRPEVLVGDPAALATYLRDVRPVAPAPVVRERVGAVILAPVDGAVIRSGSSTRVTADADLGDDVRLFVNDVPVSADRVGQLTRDAGLGRQTLEYIGVPLQAGPNRLRWEAERDGVVERDEVVLFLAGAPAVLEIAPLSPLVADTVAPLRFEIVVSDAWGVAPRDSFVTLDVAGGSIASPDGDRQQAGHQVAFRDGRGEFELAPFASPTRFTIVAAVGLAATEASFEAGAEARPWIVNGIASLGVHYRDGLRFAASGSAFARGAVFGDAVLTLAAQAPLEPLGPQGDPYDRFPVTGSSGVQSADAQSRHGVFARLERGQDYVQYGDFVTGFAGGLQTARAYTGLSGAFAAANGFGVRAYAAYVPVRDVVADLELPSDGTSAYRLPHAPVRPGTLRLEVVKRARADGRLVLDDGDPLLRTLVPAADYVLDEIVGVILLVRPLPLADGDGNPYALRAGYQVTSLDDAPSFAQFGVQASYDVGGVTVRAGVSQETRGAGDFERLASVGAAVAAGGLAADLDVGFGSDASGGGLAVALGVRYTGRALRAEADYRFFGVGYRGGGVVDDARAGHAARFAAAYAWTPTWSLAASGRWSSSTVAGASDLEGRFVAAFQGRGDVRLGDRVVGSRPRAELGLQADAGGVRALGSVALRDVLGLPGSEVRVTHLQGLGVGVSSRTELGVAIRVSDALEVRLTDRIVWGRGHALLLGLQSSFEHAEFARLACQAGGGPCDPGSAPALGRSTVIAQYEIPGGVSAAAGSLRVGMDTRYPLGERWRIEGSAAQVLDFDDAARNATVLAAGLVYDDEDIDAGVRFEARITPEGVKQVGTLGATGALGAATFASVQVRYLVEPAAAEPRGLGFSVALAHRGDRISLLTQHRGRFGSLQAAGEREFEGDTRVSWTVTPAWELRGGHAYQWLPGDGFVDVWSIGMATHPWTGGSVGAYGRLLHDWGAGDLSPGLGLEVAQSLGCGLYGVAGVNAWSGVGVDRGAVFGQSGVYLRLDAVFDENWRCGRGAGDEER